MKRYIFYIGVGLFITFISLFMGENIFVCVLEGAFGSGGAYALKKIIDKRKKDALEKSYEMDLPDLMVHIAMFTEAGLGIRDSVEKSVLAGNREKPLYRDLYIVFEKERKIGSKDFTILLEELVNIRKSPSLSNFSAVIIQNIRKGSDELSRIFANQAQIYRNERRRIAAKLADEAATLLLIPSTIVLIALVLLLLAPAIMAFSRVF